MKKMYAIYLMLLLIIIFPVAPFTGGVSAAEKKHIFEVTAVNNATDILTVFQIYAPDERQASENVAANGWKVLSVKMLHVSVADQTPGNLNNNNLDIGVGSQKSSPVNINSIANSGNGYYIEDVDSDVHPVGNEQKDLFISSILDNNTSSESLPDKSSEYAEISDKHLSVPAITPDTAGIKYMCSVFFNLGGVEPVMSPDAIKDMSILSKSGKYYLFGNSDNISVIPGTQEYQDNIDLSVKRAEAVKKYLISIGINTANIEIIGLGSRYPAAKNLDNAGGTVQNRRVDIYGFN